MSNGRQNIFFLSATSRYRNTGLRLEGDILRHWLGRFRLESSGSGYRQIAYCCEHSNGHSGSIKRGEFDWPAEEMLLLKKIPDSWSLLKAEISSFARNTEAFLVNVNSTRQLELDTRNNTDFE